MGLYAANIVRCRCNPKSLLMAPNIRHHGLQTTAARNPKLDRCPTVSSAVRQKILVAGVRLAALVARERLVVCVSPPVPDEVGHHREAIAARLALVRPLSRVGALVRLEAARELEPLAAHLAPVGHLLPRGRRLTDVQRFVPGHVGRQIAAIGAEATPVLLVPPLGFDFGHSIQIGLLVRPPPVFIQVGQREEEVPAVATQEAHRRRV